MLSERNLRDIYESVELPCLILKPDPPRFTIVDANESYLQATKSSRDELIGKGVFEAFPANPEDPYSMGVPNLLTSIEHVLKNKSAHDMVIQKYDIPVRGTNRFEVKYWHPKNYPLPDSNGETEYILHTVRDVTDRIMRQQAEAGVSKAEKHLQNVNKRLVDILESITDGFYTVNRDWVVTYWNNVAERLLNRKREEVLGRNLWSVYPPSEDSTIHRIHSTYHRVMQERVSATFREYYKPLDTWFEVSVYPGADGLSVYFKDVTEQTRREEEKQKDESEKLELINELTRNNRDLRRFSYITSHNLRSPVVNLTSLVYLLNRIPADHEDVEDILSDIRTSARILKETVDDLTNILVIRDNPTAGQEKVMFSDVLKHVLDQAGYLMKEHNPLIASDFSEVPEMTWNRVYLESILMNLITNSFKFRAEERRLEIAVSTKNEKDHVLLEFRDNGTGLDMERYRDRFFGLYQKFHNNHSDSKGLGLFLVKTQIEALGGNIEARSRPGEGMRLLLRFRKNGSV